MGAFNSVLSDQVCPSCHNRVQVRVQFKYGDTWQYEYQLGDHLTWGGNSKGKPGAKQVVADGAAEAPCASCNHELPDYEVWIEDDKIVDVRPASGEFTFVGMPETYIVLKPS